MAGYDALLNGEEMKVYKKGDFDVTGIDFCCKEMAEGILLNRITTRPWTDHPLQFWSGDLHLRHCPYCGAKIDGESFRQAS